MKILKTLSIALMLLATANCATNITQPTKSALPSKVRFSNFKKVEIQTVKQGKHFKASNANKRALRKINTLLMRDLKEIFPGAKQVSNFSKSSTRTLRITPYIEDIKFVSIAKRILFSWMAGSSAVLMNVDYKDSRNNRVVADPEFYRVAPAFGSLGIRDNRMLVDVVGDIVKYSSDNK